MFCPVCKCEYRPGFKECSDCHIALVDELPREGAPNAYSVLWKGENAAFGEKLAEDLDSAGIGCVAIPLDVLFRNSHDMFGITREPFFGSAVCVATSDFPSAQRILEKLLEEEPGEDLAGLEASKEEAEIAAVPPDLPLNWDRTTATVEVWRGADQRAMKFIEDSLQGVGIPTRQAQQDTGLFALIVRAADEGRSREIVRGISVTVKPQGAVPRMEEYVWVDEPVRSYSLFWAGILAYLLVALPVVALPASRFEFPVIVAWVFACLSVVTNIGAFWMLYQSIRYEIVPLRFVLLSFVPFSFVWYYYERYLRRHGVRKLPIAVRMRMLPPSA